MYKPFKIPNKWQEFKLKIIKWLVDDIPVVCNIETPISISKIVPINRDYYINVISNVPFRATTELIKAKKENREPIFKDLLNVQ